MICGWRASVDRGMVCQQGWHAIIIVIVVIEILSLKKNVECLLLRQKWKNVPNRLEQWFKRRTWLEEQLLVYKIWIGNASILNMPGSTEILPNVGNRDTRKRCGICSKLTMKTQERCHWGRFRAFIVNFEHISHLFLFFLLLTFYK